MHKRKVPKVVVATGIPGCGRNEYLKKVVAYCEKGGKKVKVFNVGEMMFEYAEKIGQPLDRVNILNADRKRRDAIRYAVLKEIADSHPEKEFDVIVLSIHAKFLWKKVMQVAFDPQLTKLFHVDMFITFVDDYRMIIERLNRKEQWRQENFSDEEILQWQNDEAELTKFVGKQHHTPCYCIPSSDKEPASTFFKLVFRPEMELVYPAGPISHFKTQKERAPIDRIITLLNQYFIVISPLSVEIVGSVDVRRDSDDLKTNQAVYNHIVYRDVELFVDECDITVGMHPKRVPPEFITDSQTLAAWPESVGSPGRDQEVMAAFQDTKTVWVVLLSSDTSPFVAYRNRRIFRGEEEFAKFLEETYPERKKMVW